MSISPIRVLQVLPHLNSGGVVQGALDLSSFMTKKGFKSFVCSQGGERLKDLQDHGADHITLPVHSKNPFVIYRNIQELCNLIQHLGIDIVHARSRAPAWSAYYACKKAKIPFVTTFHGTYNFRSPLKKLYNSVMVRGNYVIAISEFIKKHILQKYKFYIPKDTKIRVIYRGVDLNTFNPDKISSDQIKHLKSALAIDPQHKVVLLPGRLTRWKGQLTVIEAMSLLADQDITCLLVGPDQGRRKYKKELYKKIMMNGLEDKIKILGDIYPMPLIYALADVVVHASTDPEAFGRVIAEAQAMGKPIISNDLGAPKEIVLRNETGWLVPPKKAYKLADKIQFVLGLQEAQLRKIALKARRHVAQSFSKEQMCSTTLLVYEDLLNR